MTAKQDFDKACNEEQFKAAFRAHLPKGSKFETHERIDLRSEDVLLEFKGEKGDISKPGNGAYAVLAQAIAYCRFIHLKKGKYAAIQLPKLVVCVDPTDAIVFKYADLHYLASDDTLWPKRITASKAGECKGIMDKLTADGAELYKKGEVYMFTSDLEIQAFYKTICNTDGIARLRTRTPITRENAMLIATEWLDTFEPYLNPTGTANTAIANMAPYFVADASVDPTSDAGLLNRSKSELCFKGLPGVFKIKIAEYDAFWSKYERPLDPGVLSHVQEVSYVLMDSHHRAKTGAFNTDLNLVKLVYDMMDKSVPAWRGKTVYDPCAGTGNLLIESGLQPSQIIMSTLETADVTYLQGLSQFKGAEVFQCDFLNDQLKGKCGNVLKQFLDNKGAGLVVLMNPPYANDKDKKSISGTSDGSAAGQTDTSAKRDMVNMGKGIGKASNELFAQFLFRVNELFPFAEVVCISTLKYVLKPDFHKFQDVVWKRCAVASIVVNAGDWFYTSKEINGTVKVVPLADFPIAAIIWGPNDKKGSFSFNIETTPIEVKRKGKERVVRLLDPMRFVCCRAPIPKWISRPKCDKRASAGFIHALPMSNALTYKTTAARLEATADKGFGYCVINSGAVQHTGLNSYVSGVMSSAHGTAITPDTFTLALTTTAFIQSIEHTWLNHDCVLQIPKCDQVAGRKPNTTNLPLVDQVNAVVYALFHDKNKSACFTVAKYGDKIVNKKLDNQFYPFPVQMVRDELVKLGPDGAHLLSGLRAELDTYTATWLANNAAYMSDPARDVLDAGWELYKAYYKWLCTTVTTKETQTWHLQYYNVGLYQIKMATKESGVCKAEKEVLKAKMKILREEVQKCCAREQVY